MVLSYVSHHFNARKYLDLLYCQVAALIDISLKCANSRDSPANGKSETLDPFSKRVTSV